MTSTQPLRPLGGDIPDALRLDIQLANEVLQHSLDAIDGALTGSRETIHTR